jgi:hypothetical protein
MQQDINNPKSLLLGADKIFKNTFETLGGYPHVNISHIIEQLGRNIYSTSSTSTTG